MSRSRCRARFRGSFNENIVDIDREAIQNTPIVFGMWRDRTEFSLIDPEITEDTRPEYKDNEPSNVA